MRRPELKAAFSEEEKERASLLLARKIARMGMRKFEEGDWSEVYTDAKGIPRQTWSNLDLDVVHGSLGVEQKMLGTNAKSPRLLAGKSPMHPAATRSIRVPLSDVDAEQAKDDILGQYANLIEGRRSALAEASGEPPDLRTGWLLWKRDLSEFLYFEEELLAPDPGDFRAEWIRRPARGSRKATTNLWIYELETDVKRYSVTGSGAGAKIQPYFDVPSDLSAPEVSYFRPQGERVAGGNVRTWVRESTAAQLHGLIGELKPREISDFVGHFTEELDRTDPDTLESEARALELSESAYQVLREALPGRTDDERFEALLRVALQTEDIS